MSFLGLALLVATSCLIIRSIYRLYLHPLRRIPGPRLAAITHLYEFYYDVLCRGRFIWEIERLHKQYGGPSFLLLTSFILRPIIRINPREVHVIDPSFYDEIYARNCRPRDKDAKFVPTFGLPFSLLSTIGHRQHRFRRSILSSFFSKRSVMDIGFLIEEKTRKLMQRLEEFYENQQVVQLDSAFVALTSDIITSYCYGESGDFLDDSSFRSDIRDSVIDATSICHFVRFFPFVISMITAVPTSVMRIIMPGKAGLLDFQQSIAEKASQTLKGSRSSIAGHETIYDKLVQPSIPAEERSIQRIQDESSLVLAAGTETTSRIITIAMFYLSTNKPMLDTLRAELKRVLPTPTSSTTWVQLEKLPYLTGVIRESLRLGHGITCRLPRVAPDEVLKYGAFEIQSGTPMSTSTVLLHRNADIFPDPDKFDPNRWINKGEIDNTLARYIVSFTRGSRICLGLNLAYSELYTVIAYIARRFSFEMYNTTLEDVTVTRDMMVGYTSRGDLQVYAKVTNLIQE
ncbi:uncharacterized protein N7473_012794 [Penicillium subrubescens]|uniref:uncharacterized protein n=1 Tax=Penicillium subrubescens TaxID=1316194 RepID=UPI00254535FC|nr:uncharacterized protein N7473_012794 [Penicillium subrubescens]KAJ5875447.1 hypothetical protein N7473_012794 [Penicillium subrubescens]